MADEQRIGGVSFVSAAGRNILLGQGTHTVSLMEREREGIAASGGGGAGYVERGRIPFIEIEGLSERGLDMDWLQDLTDVTVVSELANGRIATLRNAWVAGPIDVDVTAGTLGVRFEGMAGEWL